METIGTDFTKGNISHLLIAFMIPFLLANLLTDLYNMVDMIIIGRFVGSTGIVAVTLGGKLLSMCTNISVGLAAGGQIYIAQQIGAGSVKKDVSAAIGTLFSYLAVLSFAAGLLSFLFSETVLRLLDTPEASFNAALSYFRITSAGMPLVFGYNAVSSVLRGMGDSKRPLLFIAIAALTNLILDLVFVVVFRMGAAGTALATVIGQGFAFSFSILYLYRHRELFLFDFKVKSFRIDIQKLKIMMAIGVPMALQTILIQGTQLVILRFVNGLGVAASAAYGIVEKIITMSSIVTQSIKSAGGSIAGQNIGAGFYERVKETLYAALKITLLAAAFLSTVFLLLPETIFGIFTEDPAVMAYAPSIMLVAASCCGLSALMGCYDIITTGTGNSKLSFLAGVLDGVVFRLALCWLFGIHLNMGVVGFFMGNSFARIGPILVHASYYYSGAWKRRKRLVDD